jgi:hypothetical protein
MQRNRSATGEHDAAKPKGAAGNAGDDWAEFKAP